MNLLPHIVDLYAVPALSTAGDSLLVGVALDNGRVHWGTCAKFADAQSIVSQVQPILADRPLALFAELVAQLDNFRVEVTVTRVIQPEQETSASAGAISRRKLISGFLAEDEPLVQQVQVVEKRPLPASLRFAVSHALFQAAAAASNQSLLSLLADLYGLSAANEKIPLHVEATETNIAVVRSILPTQVASLGYNTGSANHKTTLGANAERLQAHVRQVKTWIESAAPGAAPAIHLNIQGGFTELYENDEGKMLGALYGLEQAAKPYALVMENIVMGEETPARSAAEVAVARTLRKLQSYLGVRKMCVRLAAGNDLFSTNALTHFVERKAVHLMHLDVTRFGSIPQIMTFVQKCHEQNRQVILKCDEESGVETAVALALTTHAHALSGPPHLLYNEMLKTI
ncbi:MAG: hypothetical protein KC419_01550 [Anaerolineales bacterium]|nr:hypothetical protein [Anaerolineales bacterium]